MNLDIKKIIIFSLALIIIFNSSGGFLKFQKAEAALVVSTPISDAQREKGFWTDVAKYAKDFGQWITETFWEMESKWAKMMRDIIAKRILDYITNETVKWIQGGGKPKFIGNWEGFVKDVGDIAFDSVMKEVGLEKLCLPFGLNIMIGLLPVEDFSQRITCTLDKVVSNIQNFYVDFSVGGWRGYNLLWQPENNYYGVAINIADEVMKRTAEKKDAAKSEGLAGSGFMGDKICKAGSGKNKELVGDIGMGGGDDQSGQDCSTRGNQCMRMVQDEPEKKKLCAEEITKCLADAKNRAGKKKGYDTDRSGENCDPKDMVDANPGSLVGKAVGEAITSDSKWAANIQSWVSALVNAVINRVIKEGVLKMQEITSDKKDSYWPAEYGSMLGQEWEKDKEQMYGEINRFTNEWQYLLNSKNQALSSASSTLAILQQLQQIQLTASSTLPLACEPLVTAQDIQNIQNEINRLTTEIQVLQAKIGAADSARAAINVQLVDLGGVKQIAPDEFQRAAAQTAYQNFINQYGTTAQIEAIVSGSDRQAADTDAQTKQTELDNIQIRLNACQAAINPPPAP